MNQSAPYTRISETHRSALPTHCSNEGTEAPGGQHLAEVENESYMTGQGGVSKTCWAWPVVPMPFLPRQEVVASERNHLWVAAIKQPLPGPHKSHCATSQVLAPSLASISYCSRGPKKSQL